MARNKRQTNTSQKISQKFGETNLNINYFKEGNFVQASLINQLAINSISSYLFKILALIRILLLANSFVSYFIAAPDHSNVKLWLIQQFRH